MLDRNLYIRCPFRARTTCIEPFYCPEHMSQYQLGTQDRFNDFCVPIDVFARINSLRIAMMKDDEGNSGAGIHNLGENDVKGD